MGVVKSLLVEGVDLILRNDTVGGRIGALPLVSKKPVDQEMQVVDETGDLFPVRTMAQCKRLKMETHDGDHDLAIANL